MRPFKARQTGEETMDVSPRRAWTTRSQGLERRMLMVVGLQWALAAAMLAVVFTGTGRADDVQAKIGYCKDCHGPSAQGYNGFFPIPRLAGQQPEYLKNQLHAFIEHRRTNNIMFNVAHTLNPALITALAESFRRLNPPPVGGAPSELVSKGRDIFENGVPEANVAACAACHGPEATGSGIIPRLAGQLYPYVIKELTNWGKERGQNPQIRDTSAIMSPVAHSLNASQIKAVAAFVSSLK